MEDRRILSACFNGEEDIAWSHWGSAVKCLEGMSDGGSIGKGDVLDLVGTAGWIVSMALLGKDAEEGEGRVGSVGWLSLSIIGTEGSRKISEEEVEGWEAEWLRSGTLGMSIGELALGTSPTGGNDLL